MNDFFEVTGADLYESDKAFVTIVHRYLTQYWPGFFDARRGYILNSDDPVIDVLRERRKRVVRTYQPLTPVMLDRRATVLEHLDLPLDFEPCYPAPIAIQPL